LSVNKTEAIKIFLTAFTQPDLASMYNHDMEVQVNVAQDNGERVEGEYEGAKWLGYSDGINTWKSFRIPRNASTVPEYTDHPLTFDCKHIEGIGMTGWDWVKRCSRWVAFDFDAITGHSEAHQNKLTADELKKVRDAASNLPWVTTRYSTSGNGLHLYVMLDNVHTENHTEHAALARAILAKMSSLTGYDFSSKVDIAGGNMWVYHRKMKGTRGLELIKQGDVLTDVPPNWKDHIKVVKGVSKKLSAPTDIESLGDVASKFDVLSGQRNRVKLDTDHLKHIKYLNDNSLFHWWDADRHMLVTHTASLKRMHTELGLKGLFETETKASSTHNCFLYPMRKGAWSVRRFSPGCKEHPSWTQDGQGWTYCYFNQDPNLATASTANGGKEDPTGGYHFDTGEAAMNAANSLGASVKLNPKYAFRPTVVKPHKDGNRLVIEIPVESNDNAAEMTDWLKKGNKWIQIFSAARVSNFDSDTENYDDLVRHLITEGDEDSGWVINSDGHWHDEPLMHIKPALVSMNVKRNEVESIIGASVLKPWTLVSKPFQPEYPGDRLWNRRSPQLRFVPSMNDVLSYPTWSMILNHVGGALTSSIEKNEWCKRNNIKTGGEYLKLWIASMIQYPNKPLPYLFIYSEKQETGKSSLHEAISMLFNPGFERIDHALKNTSTFNAELEGAILGVTEETDLNSNKKAYDRIKDWVTSLKISIHRKGSTPYMIENTLHMIQTANHRNYCPIFDGDTRITMIHIPEKPGKEIPKDVLFAMLEKEAADFLGSIIKLEIPEASGRLRIPVIETQDKIIAAAQQRNALEEYISENCHHHPGEKIPLAEFYDKFFSALDPGDRPNWSTKNSVSKAMPDWVTRGRWPGSSQHCYGNISFKKPLENPPKPLLVCVDGFLRPTA
jgi:hypothetical protein